MHDKKPSSDDSSRSELVITEGTSGTWFYHLSIESSPTRSLCGAQTMTTSIPITYWNHVVPKNHHLPERFCSKCETARLACKPEK